MGLLQVGYHEEGGESEEEATDDECLDCPADDEDAAEEGSCSEVPKALQEQRPRAGQQQPKASKEMVKPEEKLEAPAEPQEATQSKEAKASQEMAKPEEKLEAPSEPVVKSKAQEFKQHGHAEGIQTAQKGGHWVQVMAICCSLHGMSSA